jgi:hypothetical protein
MRLLSELPALKRLRLGNAKITDAGVRTLCSMPSLEDLWLIDCRNVTEEGASLLRQSGKHVVVRK